MTAQRKRWSPATCACQLLLTHPDDDPSWAAHVCIGVEHACPAHVGLEIRAAFLQIYAESMAVCETHAAIEAAHPERCVDIVDPATGRVSRALPAEAWSGTFDADRTLHASVGGAPVDAALVSQPTATVARCKALNAQLRTVTPPDMTRRRG